MSFITIFTLVAAAENWSGAREWEATKVVLEEENIELDFRKMIPEMPKPEDNFCATPLIRSISEFEHDRTENFEDILSSTGETVYKNPEIRERFLKMRLPDSDEKPPLPEWSLALKAELSKTPDISEILATHEKDLAGIDAAAMRPVAQLPVDIGDTFVEHVSTVLPHLHDFRGFQKFQTLRACIALEAGDTAEAKAALRTLIQIARSSSSQPTLISFLVGQTGFSDALSVIWQGMATNSWSDEDLKWIQDELGKQHFLDALERALTFEMVTFQIGSADFMKSVSFRDSRHLVTLIGSMDEEGNSSSSAGILALAIPSGVWDHNKSLGARLMLKHCILPVRNREVPDDKALLDALEKTTPRNFLAKISIPAVSSVAIRGYRTNVAIDLARVACALERYQLKAGGYPDTLGVLAPEFINKIPGDLMAKGQPLKYKKGLNGDRYRIYSIGQDGTDDGGEITLRESSKTPRQKTKKGDWVWGY